MLIPGVCVTFEGKVKVFLAARTLEKGNPGELICAEEWRLDSRVLLVINAWLV